MPGVSPNDVTSENYLDLEARINTFIMYPIKWRTRFLYHPGDTVIMKLAAAGSSSRSHFRDKISITGYDQEQPQYRVAVCATRPS